MTHLWVRAEPRANEDRVGIMPDGVATLLADGFRVTVEDSRTRAIPIDAYRAAGAEIAPEGAWPTAPADAIIFGLKELPDDGTPLSHRHILFGHAYKGQADGQRLLKRFAVGGGTLYDLEYLVDDTGRRVAAFGYWAGFAGAAVSLMAWAAQARGQTCPPVHSYPSATALTGDLATLLKGATAAWPTVLVIGAKGRVGAGAADLCTAVGAPITRWDLAETAHGGPFPEVLMHHVFLNCILAQPGAPVFVPADTPTQPRRLTVIGDIACDPTSDFSPVKVYDRTTTWDAPTLRVHDSPPLDVMAIDNLPSMLPVESSTDFAAQLLPHLRTLPRIDEGVWERARQTFLAHRP
ncbi:saccharopine dehydrogenase [Maribius pontilimi]|uniref:Saccharopine dehydrogenase [NAD(+), L-lysine-forming] n=1 Tax=Palleronia pontilimi TaxID=1964209 RepID=A0A934ILB4_9RHOB|nr:saccharopine dehydrogenase [Palleronia pontilimi]MBJ3764114.1 saccharopine dehydrogenase [Palleronia pontilimi]